MRGARRRFKGKYDICTFYLVPGGTLLFASLGSWTDTNFSVLGSLAANRLFLGLWGAGIVLYYVLYVRYLFCIGRYRRPCGNSLVSLSAAFLLTAVMIPYLPEKYPLGATLHVLLAFFSPILLTVGIIGFLRFLSSRNRQRFRRAWVILWALAGCALVFLLHAGFITSFLEVFVVLSLCGFLRYMERLLAV